MKSQKTYTTSITYGAVIDACARVGDIQSAGTLFADIETFATMETAQNFKLRVPPHNTMMSLYTATNPNRERASLCHDTMKQAGVTPTAHTYKVRRLY